VRANWHVDDLEAPSPKPAPDPDEAPDKQREDVRTIVRRGKGTTLTESALWDRREETEHPLPLGYWCESKYTFLTPLDELLQREVTLLDRERRLWDANVRCELKWDQGVTCSTCPVHEVGQETKLSLLCRLGREQERIHTMVRVKQKTLEGTI
jgi:hypothetical protein